MTINSANCNSLGQLGRPSNKKLSYREPHLALFDTDYSKNSKGEDNYIRGYRVYAGGLKDSGHSAVLDVEGNLWLTGCDRWQQLGLGSSSAGAAGYTWKNGRLWQEKFQRNDYVMDLIRQKIANTSDDCNPVTSTANRKLKVGQQDNDTLNAKRMLIRDVAIGGDHTLVLASNQKDVFAFGKGSEGQLGIASKPFVSAPVHSKELSIGKRNRNSYRVKEDEKTSLASNENIAAVCAVHHCSFTLNHRGEILNETGKCRQLIEDAARACREQAVKDKLML